MASDDKEQRTPPAVYRYSDRTLLPNRAINPTRDVDAEVGENPNSQTLDFCLGNAQQLEAESIRYAAEVSVKSLDVKEETAEMFSRPKALQTVLFSDLLELQGFDIIAGWQAHLGSLMSDAKASNNQVRRLIGMNLGWRQALTTAVFFRSVFSFRTPWPATNFFLGMWRMLWRYASRTA
ncbi:MAG: hypothetical protein R8G34_00720 [Paracoccaceae bacterium]|nr:hypothetical protein [Paracoccaceae bacterium]